LLCACSIALALIACVIAGAALLNRFDHNSPAPKHNWLAQLPALEKLITDSAPTPRQPEKGQLEAAAATPRTQLSVTNSAPVTQLPAAGKETSKPPLVPIQQAPGARPVPTADDPAPRGPSLPASEVLPKEATATYETYGTKVSFSSDPTDAAQKALKDRKLLFVLHLSGNFEDSKFT
jgi:hypothetical protein